MLLLLAAHVVAAVAAPVVMRWLGRRGFLLLALVPASALVWALGWSADVMDGRGPGQHVAWVPHLDMSLTFRLDTLSWLMVLLVTGVGTLVFIYSAGYFSAKAAGLGRFAGVLVAFAGSMLGLVTTDDVLLLYVFWELTTVTSYLLIGHYADRKASRRAAMQAIVVTTFGGLAMLVGLITLAESAGTYRISELVAHPPSGTAVTVAVVLVLVGALTKSALVPFHYWLPSAMAAPTPVSAYLHAAAMVKAGVYLVARFAPGFADVGAWRAIVLAVGTWTLVHGGYRALRQYDLKLVLAFGTVSQLGLLVLLVGSGNQAAALAGLAMIGAHAMFKASLFLVVGVVDAATGTRDLRRLEGVGRALPVTATVGALATASMMGFPPFAGYVAKEAALEALWHDNGTGAGVAVLVGFVVGSALTVAYGLRFWVGAFGPAIRGAVPLPAPDDGVWPPLQINRPSLLLVAPAAVLAALGLATALVPAFGEELLSPHAALYPGDPGHLTLWAGIGPAFWLTVVVLAAGGLMYWQRVRVEGWQHRIPVRADADLIYRRMMRRLDDVAADVTGVTQRGSLPFYLGTILLVLVALELGALLTDPPDVEAWRAWDTPVQAVAGLLTAGAAVLAARARRRLKAVLLSGVSGYGMAALFLLNGAPDLALTQVLVETVTLVVLVLVLRRLPPYFSVRPLAASRWVRLAIGLAVGLVVGALAVLAPAARTAAPVSVDFPEEAYVYGGGQNVVNVTLVDIRAWDTMGEISVLLVAATGVASLIFLRRRSGEIPRVRDASDDRPVWGGTRDPMAALRRRSGEHGDAASMATGARPGRASTDALRASRTLAPQRRSVVFEVVVRLLFHSMVVVALFLLFSGHNLPGGGFAAGLLVGIALVVRYLVGGRYELGEAAPVHPGLLLGSGLFLSAGVGMGALLFGGTVLQSVIIEMTLPVFGEVKLVTSLFFDIGVFLVVVGLVLDLLRSLGAEIDTQAEAEARAEGSPVGAAATTAETVTGGGGGPEAQASGEAVTR